MYQTIHEQIAMAGVYDRGKFKPRKFKWRGRELQIHQITLQADVADGGVRKRQYSLVADGAVYRVIFNRDSEQWWLEELWVE